MTKKGAKKQDVGWTTSAFMEADLKKVKKEGFLAESTVVIFSSTEVIPALPPGFPVMFLAFLLRGFSLPAHEFLRGLPCLFMACSCISSRQISYCTLPTSSLFMRPFWASIPTRFYGNLSFVYVPM
jgi:hypothetical protein